MDGKILATIVAVVLAGGLFGFLQVTSFAALPAAGKETVKIGVVAPFTGKQAAYGEGIREGLELALEEINSDPKLNFKIELIYEDNAGDVKSGVSGAQKLMGIDAVAAVISGVSQNSMAIAPIAQERKIVLYTMASQTSALNNAGEYVFKNDDDLYSLGTREAELIFGFGHRDVAVLFAEYNDATVDAKNAFVKRFGELGGTVAVVEGYGQNETDFRTHLSKIESAKPAALFLDTLMGDNVAILKQIKEAGLKAKLFANGTVEDSQVIGGAGDAAEKVVFVTFQAPPSDSFVQKSEAKFGHYPKRWAPEAYDGLRIIAAALSKIGHGGISGWSLQEKLSEIREFSGESGNIKFDSEGNARRSMFIKVIRNGKFELYG